MGDPTQCQHPGSCGVKRCLQALAGGRGLGSRSTSLHLYEIMKNAGYKDVQNDPANVTSMSPGPLYLTLFHQQAFGG